jgi:hypothetical protein
MQDRYTTDTTYRVAGVEPKARPQSLDSATLGAAKTPTPATPPGVKIASTRIRTQNSLLEARHDFRFTIETRIHNAAEGKGFEPSSARGGTALAERPGQPYPATFRFLSCAVRGAVSGPPGNRTPISRLQAGRLPV